MAGDRLEKALQVWRKRYRQSQRSGRSAVLDEVCRVGGYHRKYAIALLNRPDEEDRPRRRRGPTYSAAALGVVETIWKQAGYPWSERLKALLPLWLPYAREHVSRLTPEIERQVLAISARQMDRRLAPRKRKLKRRLYGRTKPGALLKHQIAIQTRPWDVTEPGSAEIDLVSHSGPSARGEFAHSLNLTDVFSGWCETRAILGRGEEAVVRALDQIRRVLPFPLRAIDSDNGSEFINYHLAGYCRSHRLQFTRSRPYKKDDNARIEQKNWTHVRRVFGWDRYDTPAVVEAMNVLYRDDLRLMMNLFQPSVKLLERRRVGSRLTRRYEPARTPLDRLADRYAATTPPAPIRALLALRARLNPFDLARDIQHQLDVIERVRTAHPAHVRIASARRPAPLLPPPGGRAALELAHAR